MDDDTAVNRRNRLLEIGGLGERCVPLPPSFVGTQQESPRAVRRAGLNVGPRIEQVYWTAPSEPKGTDLP